MYYVGCACMRVCVFVRARLLILFFVDGGGGGGGVCVCGGGGGGGGCVPHACVCVNVNVYANSETSSFLEGPGQHGWICRQVSATVGRSGEPVQ